MAVGTWLITLSNRLKKIVATSNSPASNMSNTLFATSAAFS